MAESKIPALISGIKTLRHRNMAESKIPIGNSANFNLSAISGAQTDFIGYGIYSPSTHTVRIYVASRADSTVSSSEVANNIPLQYRPTLQVNGIGVINGNVTKYVQVNPNGTVTQSLSGGHLSALIIAEYTI